ncbi:hypothetical protein L6452_14852 [Arctium lappa]|uniref:Uncharacterized protein n=1 Tax=Arctium lappa TaxID=4217 RepID=A0ACB9CMQ2_ARCLA|nr:hypothetical protein L6452_14852 [Arctium lappa]
MGCWNFITSKSKGHPLKFSHSATVNIPMIYQQQFWNAVTYVPESNAYRFGGFIDHFNTRITKKRLRRVLQLLGENDAEIAMKIPELDIAKVQEEIATVATPITPIILVSSSDVATHSDVESSDSVNLDHDAPSDPDMADNAAGEHESFVDSVKEKISETFHGDDSSSSSSDSDGKNKGKGKGKKSLSVSPLKEKVNRLFGKEKSVHELLGGGKPADILLWRNKKSSICVLGFATLIWALFELIEYHLLSLLCHALIIVLGIHFLWSNTFNVIYRCPQFPQIAIQEETALHIASVLRLEINKSLVVLREIASGKDLKKFLAVIASLWIVSIAGSCCNLLTLVYICFVLVLTVPLLYERQKDQIDVLIEKAEDELKKQYEVFQAKVLSKVPRGQSKDKKFA